MSSSVEWKDFFDAHAPFYDQNGFAQHTVAEVDFLLKLFPLPEGATVLDIGCGTGRHSIELAKRGYRPTGIDLSSGMLQVAREKAAQAEVEVEFIQGDATQFRLEREFDLAICLCEGGFGLIGPNEDPLAHDLGILRSAYQHLKLGGGFLLTGLNGYAIIRQMKDEHIAVGRFNPASMTAIYEDTWDLPEGPRQVTIRERLFIPPEVVAMLHTVGFRCDAVYGGTAGHWAQRPVQLDEVEAMFVARKPA